MIPRSTILLTGVSSFVGAHLAAHFAKAGHNVLALHRDNADAGTDALRASRLEHARAAGAELVALDILDGDALATLIAARRPTYCIHHAGWAVRYAALDYDLAQGDRVNVQPLQNLFEALAAHGCEGIVLTGSSAEYSSQEQPCREDDPCLPDLPYGLSKLAQTLRARQLSLLTGLPARVARVFIPFGELDAPGKLLPTVREALRARRPIELSPCTQVRDFVTVGDLVQGFALLLEDCRRGGFDIVNLCGGEAVRLDALLRAMAAAMGAETSLLQFGAKAMRPGEPPVSVGDNQKAARMLDWHPEPALAAVARFALQAP